MMLTLAPCQGSHEDVEGCPVECITCAKPGQTKLVGVVPSGPFAVGVFPKPDAWSAVRFNLESSKLGDLGVNVLGTHARGHSVS